MVVAGDLLWVNEDEFLYQDAAREITSALNAFTHLKTLVISESPDGGRYVDHAMGSTHTLPHAMARLARPAYFKRGCGVATTALDGEVWQARLVAFQAILQGVVDATLPQGLQIGVGLEGTAPRQLTAAGERNMKRVFESVTCFAGVIDSFVDPDNTSRVLRLVDPQYLHLNYDIKAHTEIPNARLSLHLGTYTKLRAVEILEAKCGGEELDSFLDRHKDTLVALQLRYIYLDHIPNAQFPWRNVFKTINKITGLEKFWPTNLASFPAGQVPRNVHAMASLERPWLNKKNCARALKIIIENLDARPADAEPWVDMDHVESEMSVQFGVN